MESNARRDKDSRRLGFDSDGLVDACHQINGAGKCSLILRQAPFLKSRVQDLDFDGGIHLSRLPNCFAARTVTISGAALGLQRLFTGQG